MGQQQLFLLILGIVLVGLSVVMGINAFSRNQKTSNADAMFVEALNIATAVQAWSLKPTMMGGGLGPNTSMADATFDAVGYENTEGTYNNLTASFILDTSADAECSEPVIPSGNTALVYVNGFDVNTGNRVCVAIAGPRPEDIGTDTKYGSGVTDL